MADSNNNLERLLIDFKEARSATSGRPFENGLENGRPAELL